MFEFVVSSRRWLTGGSRDDSCDVRSCIDAVDGRGSESVDGRPRPGKEEMRTLMVVGAIAAVDAGSSWWSEISSAEYRLRIS